MKPFIHFIPSNCEHKFRVLLWSHWLMFGQIPAPGHRSWCPAPGPPAQTLPPVPDVGLCLQPSCLPSQLPALRFCGAVCVWFPGKETHSLSHHWWNQLCSYLLVPFFLLFIEALWEGAPQFRFAGHIYFMGRYCIQQGSGVDFQYENQNFWSTLNWLE